MADNSNSDKAAESKAQAAPLDNTEEDRKSVV